MARPIAKQHFYILCFYFQNNEETVEESQVEVTDYKSMLKGLPERKRRTLLR